MDSNLKGKRPAWMNDRENVPLGDIRFDRLSAEWPTKVAQLETKWTPKIHVTWQDQGFVLQMELPGITEEQFSVRVDGDEIVVSGIRESQVKGKDYVAEREFGPFARGIKLPAKVDGDRVEGDFTNGLLTLHIPQ